MASTSIDPAMRLLSRLEATAHQKNQAGITGQPDRVTPSIIIEKLYPELEGGRYPIKRVMGERLEVWADIFRDGHDVIRATLLCRKEEAPDWSSAPMTMFDNDR